jgi:hypothetical protein
MITNEKNLYFLGNIALAFPVGCFKRPNGQPGQPECKMDTHECS